MLTYTAIAPTLLNTIIYPSVLNGTVAAPPSKSVMQRACAAVLLRRGTYTLHNAGTSADDEVVLHILQQCGCIIARNGSTLTIKNNGITVPDSIYFGESGLAARMLTPLLATHIRKPLHLTAAPSLCKRPMRFFEEVLPQLGVSIALQDGHLPGTISGALQPKTIEADGSVSSQFITGLIYAYTSAGAKDTRLHLHNLVSRPYVDLTLKVLKDITNTAPVWEGEDTLYWKESALESSTPLNKTYTIESDWSSAAFLLVAGAISGNVVVTGLDVFTEQADKAILQPLMDAGASISINMDFIRVQQAALKAFHFNATDSPDLFPPLAVLAAYASGTSVIEGVHRLIHKESNRALTLQEELGKMGVSITLQDDLMIIEGGNALKGATVSSHGDHRIAMACAVAAIGAKGETIIEDAEAINKSYPAFWHHLQSLGAQIKTTL